MHVYGIPASAQIVNNLDEYYTDDSPESPVREKPALSQLLRQLCNPQPKDFRSIDQLPNYKGVADKWKSWDFIVEICKSLASEVMEKDNA